MKTKMRTFVTIVFTANGYENTRNFIRKSGFKPTYAGAARMIARCINDEQYSGNPLVKPSDLSICRVQTMGYL